MTKSTVDRRIQRTRAMLQHALNALTLEKDYESITIKDICEAANVSRSTFYTHYTSKDDLKRSGFEQLRRQLLDRQNDDHDASGGGKGTCFRFSLTMFEHAQEHIQLYQALVGGRGGAVSLGAIRAMLSDLVRHELAASSNMERERAIPREFVVQYVVGAYMAVMTWWLDGGAKLPPNRVDAMFRHLVTNGVMSK